MSSAHFSAIRHAGKYYRTIITGKQNPRNVRDSYMFETLRDLGTHLERRRGMESKIIAWAHNSHIGAGAAGIAFRVGKAAL